MVRDSVTGMIVQTFARSFRTAMNIRATRENPPASFRIAGHRGLPVATRSRLYSSPAARTSFLLWKAPQIPAFISDALLIKPAAASIESQSSTAVHVML